MSEMKIKISILLGIFLFLSCKENIEFNREITQPMIVLHSFITPDTTIMARVSYSRFFLDDAEFTTIDNADISVFINGTLKEQMNRIASGQYKSSYKPSIDDTVRLIVKVPSMKEAKSSPVVFCKAPVVISVDTTMQMNLSPPTYLITNEGDTMYSNTNMRINYTLKFSDDVNEKNYYRLSLQTRRHSFYSFSYLNYFSDIITNSFFIDNFSSNIKIEESKIEIPFIDGNNNQSNLYHIFSDDFINGKTCLLNFSSTIFDFFKRIHPSYIHTSQGAEKIEIFISLQSISKEYYLYLKTRTASQVDDFLSEPVQIYSNISGGIGFLGSYTPSNVVKFELGLVPEFMKIVSITEN